MSAHWRLVLIEIVNKTAHRLNKEKKNISKHVDSVWCLRGQQPNRMANRSFMFFFFCFCSFPSLRSEHVTACYMAYIPGRCGHKLTVVVLCRCLVMDVTRMGPHLYLRAHRLCADGLITQWRVFMDSCKSSSRVSLDQVDRIRFQYEEIKRLWRNCRKKMDDEDM